MQTNTCNINDLTNLVYFHFEWLQVKCACTHGSFHKIFVINIYLLAFRFDFMLVRHKLQMNNNNNNSIISMFFCVIEHARMKCHVDVCRIFNLIVRRALLTKVLSFLIKFSVASLQETSILINE